MLFELVFKMEKKHHSILFLFLLILGLIGVDLQHKRQHFHDYLVLKQQYFALKKMKKNAPKPPKIEVEWPYLLKKWNQNAIKFNCQIQHIQNTNNLQYSSDFQLKLSGRYWNLLAWLREIQTSLPHLVWKRIILFRSKNQTVQMLLEGRHDANY